MLDFKETMAKARLEPLDRSEALFLFRETEDEERSAELFETARFVRERVQGSVFKWSGGIARVLRCNLKPNCTFCPYWRDEGQEPLSIPEILRAVEYIKQHGIKEFHLSGGTTLGSDGLDVLHIVESIRAAGFDDIAIDVNCGATMSLGTLKTLRELGVTKVSAVFETIEPTLFKRLKPGDDLEKKKEFARTIGEAGLELGTGILVGLDPETERYQNYVEFIFHAKTYEHLSSIYVSKFFPFKGIVLKDHPACSSLEALRVLAITRLVLRNKNIGTAQGWEKDEELDPALAGSGKQGPGYSYRSGAQV